MLQATKDASNFQIQKLSYKLTRLKQVAKKNYYQNELNKHKNNLSQQWKLINEIISHKKYHRHILNVISDINNKKITDTQAFSNLFRKYRSINGC